MRWYEDPFIMCLLIVVVPYLVMVLLTILVGK